MARAKARSNIYAALPLLACLILAGGTALSYIRLEEYRTEPTLDPLPPGKPRQFVPVAEPRPDDVPVDGKAKPEGGGEAAPDEGGTVAPDEGGPAPDEGGKKAPTTAAPAPGGAREEEEEER